METSYESLQHAEREDEALSMVARSEGNIRDSTDDSGKAIPIHVGNTHCNLH